MSTQMGSCSFGRRDVVYSFIAAFAVLSFKFDARRYCLCMCCWCCVDGLWLQELMDSGAALPSCCLRSKQSRPCIAAMFVNSFHIRVQ